MILLLSILQFLKAIARFPIPNLNIVQGTFCRTLSAADARIYQDLIFDTMPVSAFSPETALFLGFSAFQGIERKCVSGPVFICCCGCCSQKRHPQSAIVKKYGYR